MKKFFRVVIILASVVASTLCALPVMSVETGGEEYCKLIVRGYNLIEFSALGFLPLIAVLLIPSIVLGNQQKSSKRKEILLLYITNTVCYLHGINSARPWLMETGDSLISYHIGILLYPLGFTGVLMLTSILSSISKLKEDVILE